MNLTGAYRSPALRVSFAALALTGVALALLPPEANPAGAVTLLAHLLFGMAGLLILLVWALGRMVGSRHAPSAMRAPEAGQPSTSGRWRAAVVAVLTIVVLTGA